VYICHCNGLTNADVQSALDGGACRTAEVYRACGCEAQCGGCTRTVLCMVRDFLSASTTDDGMMAAGD
jgi:bacterioferritin-associated ferredoxin